jgi:ABC-type nitrate/sulfonate/bicarbonate transport system substrate-binding protein
MVQGAELGVFGPWFPLNYMLVTFNDGRPTPDPFPASMEYFVGQSVGVPSLGGPGHLFVLAMLREAGIAEEAVTFVTSGAPAGWVPVVQAGQITAGVLTPNGIALFEQHDIEVTVLADPLHGNGGETIEGVAAVVMAARAPFIDDSQVFGRFCAAMTEAVDWISEPANRHAGVAVFANHLELPPDLVGNLWDAEAGLFRKQIGERDWMANVAWTTNGDSQLPYADFVHTR